MNKRLTAIAEQKLQYNSGKPCRKGHISDRYSSNGMCIECLRISNEASKGLMKVARIKRNTALFATLREHTFMVRECDRSWMAKVADIFQYAKPEVVAQLTSFVDQLHKHTPTPRALTRDDLLMFMEYHGGQVLNINDLDLSHATEDDPTLYVIHNTHRYVAAECMEVLRNQRLNVTPK